MATLTYEPEELGSLLVLLVRVAKDSNGDKYDTYDQQLSDFAKQRSQDEESDFLANVRKIAKIREDARDGDPLAMHLSGLMDTAQDAITNLMVNLVKSERWSVCGTINRDHIFQMGALLPQGNPKASGPSAAPTKGKVPVGGK
jgi:hypothetical protein